MFAHAGRLRECSVGGCCVQSTAPVMESMSSTHGYTENALCRLQLLIPFKLCDFSPVAIHRVMYEGILRSHFYV